MRISGFAGWNRFADSKRRREGASKQTAEQTREPEGLEPVFNNTNMEPTSRADAVRRSHWTSPPPIEQPWHSRVAIVGRSVPSS